MYLVTLPSAVPPLHHVCGDEPESLSAESCMNALRASVEKSFPHSLPAAAAAAAAQ